MLRFFIYHCMLGVTPVIMCCHYWGLFCFYNYVIHYTKFVFQKELKAALQSEGFVVCELIPFKGGQNHNLTNSATTL